MLLFFFSEFFFFPPWGDKQNIKYINSRQWSGGAQSRYSSGVGLTRVKLFPLLSQLGTMSKTRPHGTWLTTTKCDLAGQHVKRNKWFSLKAHYIKYICGTTLKFPSDTPTQWNTVLGGFMHQVSKLGIPHWHKPFYLCPDEWVKPSASS